ncbi:GIY-YIG nuclease family protein [Luteimonas sp. SDU101]|uniref:GIY-YIG nuclease family protein n=1 Tax=Luteimonas sp. SDU101 TaxID=3422593 RepID=UPI003EBDA1C6
MIATGRRGAASVRSAPRAFATAATVAEHARLPPRRPSFMSACYLYVLPLLNEDIAKLGISVDPLSRVRAFAARYYECFDLERSSLVGFDSVAEARQRETALHRQLRAWNADRPLTVPLRAGGHTEWYRGASATLRDEVARDRERGHPVHQPAGDWWRQRLLQEQSILFEWAGQYLQAMPGDALPQSGLWPGIVDVLDAWPALGLRVDEALPESVAIAYRRYRASWRISLEGGMC